MTKGGSLVPIHSFIHSFIGSVMHSDWCWSCLEKILIRLETKPRHARNMKASSFALSISRYNLLHHLDRHDLHCRYCSSDWDHRAAFRIFRSLPPNQKWQEPLQKPNFMIDWWNPSGAAKGSTFTGTAWWSGWCRCQTWRFESDLSIWNFSINRLNNQIDRQ